MRPATRSISPAIKPAHIRKGPGQAYPVVVDVAVSVNPNTITLAIPASQTSGLSGKYIWDLELTSTEGIVTTILHGYVNVSNEVTRYGMHQQQLTAQLVEPARFTAKPQPPGTPMAEKGRPDRPDR